jgi:hypothetical protein
MLDLLEPVAASAPLLALGLLFHCVRMAARARAWHNIATSAYPDAELRFRHSLGACACGAGLNAVAPARPGEVLKLALVRKKAPDTAYQGLASTLLTESLFDTVMAVVAVATGIALGWTSLSGALGGRHVWIVVAVAVAGGLGVFAARRRAGAFVRRLTAGASRGFAVLAHPGRYIGTVISWQVVALGLRLASILCFLAAFHVPATLHTAVIVLCVQSLANLVPLTPNGAGTQQALLVVALGTTAGASSLVGFGAGAQLATVVAEVVLGLVSLLLMTGSLRWRQLVAATA